MSNFRPFRKATVILRDMPRDIRDHFKAYAARRGRSMKDLVIEFMRGCIRIDARPAKTKKGKRR